MQTRKLGYSDLHLTMVGLGTWAIGGPWQWGWGPQDDQESIRTIQEAFDLGINWIDTAPAYGVGHSEEIVGKAITGRRDEVIVATKSGIVGNPNKPGTTMRKMDAAGIISEVDNNLRRLNIEVIDLYQIHWPIPDEMIEEAWGGMAELVKVGKVRYIGVSNFSVEQMKRVQPIHPIASLQPPYSMVRREIEDELIDFCAANEIGIVVYSPMQAGLLTGKFSQERLASLPDGDWRRTNDQFKEPRFSATLALVEKLRPIAERNGKSLAQLSIAWTLRLPAITSAIVGARRPSQIVETAAAGDWNLSPEDVAEIDTLLDWHTAQLS
ncbi:MAG: aldo/keto reductase [Anaerolineae bacterium]|nr:aldo/keto reductase [Anaerolineae bacterium]